MGYNKDIHMKIYAARKQINEEYSELEFYLEKISNQDLWLAIRQEDWYNVWVRTSTKSGVMLFDKLYNSAYYSVQSFLSERALREPDLTYEQAHVYDWELIQPITILTSEELAPYIASENDRYMFNKG